mmetsp:Transcript_74965/g.163647  ORF Transcript_74965/g.163647 Transcript_74965/m.163647 type:complete len:378 (-) Transcript_74965:372-1505(-)|eukprot:CAMPEP_0206575130 /NCGR_PEP_ID=MMETSP0325_2-20121206/29876_1 /ASSEMBLY_ACC=CAM_ASM_000347 /TAXON_ID=2866 /ORGANISM="Crypthecodinium cohnii, Strain Seligo" /LENGTH=377 /DNA_ID=CAMNT_0054079903 /DNA_START=71 /DNA_END=1204 /DNA_ORIENTATION=+
MTSVTTLEEADGVMQQMLSVRSPVPASALFAGLITVLSLGRLVSASIDEAFALIPHHTVFTSTLYCPVPFLWNLLTAHFFEANIVKAFLAAPLVFLLTRALEAKWSTQTIILHVLPTVGLSGLVFFVLELVHVYRTHHDKEWFVSTRGTAALLLALAMALRQACPHEVVPHTPPALRLQSRHLPFCLLCIYCVLGLALPGLVEDASFAPPAFFFGWLHLRYTLWIPHLQVYGDHSDDFTFASLFPKPLQPIFRCIGIVSHSVLVRLCPTYLRLRQASDIDPHASHYDHSRAAEDGVSWVGRGTGMTLASMPANSPKDDPASKEYAARRAKALALLDQNINSFLEPRPNGSAAALELAGGVSGKATAPTTVEGGDDDI